MVLWGRKKFFVCFVRYFKMLIATHRHAKNLYKYDDKIFQGHKFYKLL